MNDEKNIESCEYLCIHEDAVKKVQDNMPPDEYLYDLAELFKMFGDTTRIKILYALFENELCVCDIAQLLGLTGRAAPNERSASGRDGSRARKRNYD